MQLNEEILLQKHPLPTDAINKSVPAEPSPPGQQARNAFTAVKRLRQVFFPFRLFLVQNALL